jgi:hypothetical protein
VTVWTRVDSHDPDGTSDLMAQRLNVFVCPHCGCMALLDVSLTYVDQDLSYCIHYVCKRDLARDAFYASVTKQGRFIRDQAGTSGEAHTTDAHIVFSMREVLAYIHFRDQCARYGS